jgi:hypothetical protein
LVKVLIYIYMLLFYNGLLTLTKFVAKLFVILCHCLSCLGHLGRCDTDRIISIFVTPPKVAKASTSVSLSCVIVTGVIALTFA